MKQLLIIVGVLVGGLGAGYLLGADGDGAGGRAPGAAGQSADGASRVLEIEDLNRIRALELENDSLRARLAHLQREDETFNPYPNDTIEAIEKLKEDAFADNNVDWFLQVLERLLRMGEDGYPALRRLLEDVVFRRRFMPAESDFRIDQIYSAARVFTNHERQFIGFLNYLLNEPNAHPYFKQGAMMGGAFYMGSNAPGVEDLRETMTRLFMEQAGVSVPGMLPGNIGKRMQVFAMAMSGDPKMAGPLRDELGQTKDKDLQGDIIGALAYLGDPNALPLVQERLDPTQGDYRREIQALGRIGTEEAHQTAADFIRKIPDSDRFYRHASRYVRQGGGGSAVLLMKERIQSNPNDPEINGAIGSLRRYPSKESLDTLNTIATTTTDKKMAERATEAAAEVDRVLRGEFPSVPQRE